MNMCIYMYVYMICLCENVCKYADIRIQLCPEVSETVLLDEDACWSYAS